jgi:hypothetical protein
MPTNRVYPEGKHLSVVVTNPTGPLSGQPLRVGYRTGVALTDEGEGGNAATQTTVDFGAAVWKLSVTDHGGAGIAAGDALFYVDGAGDAAGTIENDSAGYFFGFALEAVAAGQTATILVAHVDSPAAGALGAGTVGTVNLANGAVTAAQLAANAVETAKIKDANVTQAKLALASLDGTVAKVVADANVIGGLPVLFRIDCPDAAGNVDVVSTHKIRVLDAWGLNTGVAAHATADTWQVKNGANAISDAVAKTATVNAVKRIATIDPAQAEIAAGGTLRITTAKGAGALNAAVTVYVLALRVG